MGLINSSDYNGLPIEPVSRWLKLKDFLDKRLTEVADYQNGSSLEDLEEYCVVLVNAARTLGLGDFDESSDGNIAENHKYYRPRLIALAANLSIKPPPVSIENSVALGRPARAKVIQEIEHLRASFNQLEISDSTRRQAFVCLSTLEQLIIAPRSDFAKVFAVLTQLSVCLGGVTTTLALIPQAYATIIWLMGEEKKQEDEEVRLLAAKSKPLQIEDQRPRPYDDDENPF